jgi:tRNA splicing ligase
MNTLKEFVEQNPKLVTRKESKTYPGLFVLKYTRNVFFDALWHKSRWLELCRGLVVDSEYNVVIRGFDKIFNYTENGAGDKWTDDTIVLCTRKVNGFCGFLTNVKGKLIISTTGSLDSDFVGYAHEYLKDITPKMCREHVTYLFEICHPLDPHIVPEKTGAHFLGAVEHDLGQHHYKFDASFLIEDAVENFSSVGVFVEDETSEVPYKVGELKKFMKTVMHEGYVIVNPLDNSTLKIKSPHYLVSKFLARVGTDRLVKGILNGSIKAKVEEEYYSLIDQIKLEGVEKFAALTEQERLAYVRIWSEQNY